MSRVRQHGAMVLLAALGVLLATTARAQTLPRLPEDFIFPASEGSPGQVKFVHRTHVDGRRPDCTTCHPGVFKILAPGATVDGASLGHEAMEQGRQCGACHNDKAAFGFGDAEKCTACHSVSGPD